MRENGEIYTAGINFTLSPAVTAVTNLTSVNAIGPETYFTIKRLKKWSPNGHQVVTRWGVDLVYSLLAYLISNTYIASIILSFPMLLIRKDSSQVQFFRPTSVTPALDLGTCSRALQGVPKKVHNRIF